MPDQASKSTIPDELRTEMLAEYSALREEMVKRVGLRYQVLSFTLVVAGTFLSLGAGISTLIPLMYPILAVFLAITWSHNDVRIWEAGGYIRNKIEERLKGVGWETDLHDKRAKSESRFRPTEVSASGIFLVTDALALVTAIPRLTFSTEVKILLVGDLIAIAFTFVLLQSRSRLSRRLREDADG